MTDDEHDFDLVEHELHETACLSLKPMVELEIAQSVTDANRGRIAVLEATLTEVSAELKMIRAQSTKQSLVIASMEKLLASRDTTLQHCTTSLMTVNSQYQEAQTTMQQQGTVIQQLRDQLNQLEIQYELTREDLKKESAEFRAFKQCVSKPKRTHPADQIMSSEGKPTKFINSLFEPSLFR